MKPYITLEAPGEAYYEIQKSKFYAYTAPAQTEEEARNFVTSIKKKHFDARHNCSAWILGIEGTQQKSNDDGEPGGTAGNPILEAIKQQGLTNTVVVVTRYFGGIKLGAGGLIRAYNHSATLGLKASPQLEVRPFCPLQVSIDYSLLGTVENWIRTKEVRHINTDYTDIVTLKLLIEPKKVQSVEKELIELTAANCLIEIGQEEFIALPLKK